MDVKNELFERKDEKYREFHCRLMPAVPKEKVIGVRTPDVRKIAKQLKCEGEDKKFLKNLPHEYYEENNIHGFLISEIKDFDLCIYELNRFLPYVDNWATCDGIRPKIFGRNTEELLCEIEKWLKSEHTYTVRFAIEMLMVYYLDDKFDLKYPKILAQINSEEYYINMMLSWYFATALSKQWESIIPFIEEKCLSKWVHNKTIQKARESYRITKEQKEYLKKFRI